MGATLGCPVGSNPAAAARTTASDACGRLVSCGLLAAEYYQLDASIKQPCAADSDCSMDRGGRCRTATDGRRLCHLPLLDRRWCHVRLTQGSANPCKGKQQYTALQLTHAMRCIMATPCAALGLSFGDKLLPAKQRPAMDQLTCDDGKTNKWTATACDHGLLHY